MQGPIKTHWKIGKKSPVIQPRVCQMRMINLKNVKVYAISQHARWFVALTSWPWEDKNKKQKLDS